MNLRSRDDTVQYSHRVDGLANVVDTALWFTIPPAGYSNGYGIHVTLINTSIY